jgi:sortase A
MVKEGGDEKTLSRAVGLIPGSAKPGTNGNTVLAGHRDTFFRPLQKIKVNDQIRLTVPPNTYEYRVQWVSVVSPDDTELLKSRGTEELTLVTCYPFSMIGPAPDRFIVNAVRIN